MGTAKTVMLNWRDVDCYVSHESAVIWAILTQQNEEHDDPNACMRHISGFARHFLQGHKNSDHTRTPMPSSSIIYYRAAAKC